MVLMTVIICDAMSKKFKPEALYIGAFILDLWVTLPIALAVVTS